MTAYLENISILLSKTFIEHYWTRKCCEEISY